MFYLSPETHSLSSAMTHLQSVNALHNSSTPTLRSFPECSIPSPDTHFTSRRTSNPEVPHCFQKYSSILLKHSTSRGALQLISRKAPFSEILRLAILGMQKSLILKQNKKVYLQRNSHFTFKCTPTLSSEITSSRKCFPCCL